MPLAPAALPPIDGLRRRAQALAMLEAVVCPDWDSRYYSFNTAWSPTEAMASMRNGEGDHWFILFAPAGAGIKGLAHESAAARDPQWRARTRQAVPASLSGFLDEPAFDWAWASFCYWCETGDTCWHAVATAVGAQDGSEELLELLMAPASAYVDFAADYYETALPLQAVEAFYAHQPLTAALVALVNPHLSIDDVQADAREIGYPAD